MPPKTRKRQLERGPAASQEASSPAADDRCDESGDSADGFDLAHKRSVMRKYRAVLGEVWDKVVEHVDGSVLPIFRDDMKGLYEDFVELLLEAKERMRDFIVPDGDDNDDGSDSFAEGDEEEEEETEEEEASESEAEETEDGDESAPESSQQEE